MQHMRVPRLLFLFTLLVVGSTTAVKVNVTAVTNSENQPIFSFIYNSTVEVRVVTDGELPPTEPSCQFTLYDPKALGKMFYSMPATLVPGTSKPTYSCQVFAIEQNAWHYGPPSGFISIALTAELPNNVTNGPIPTMRTSFFAIPLLWAWSVAPTQVGTRLLLETRTPLSVTGTGFLGSCGDGVPVSNVTESSTDFSIGESSTDPVGSLGEALGCFCLFKGVTYDSIEPAGSTLSSSSFLGNAAGVTTRATVISDTVLECSTPSVVSATAAATVAVMTARSSPTAHFPSPAWIVSNALNITFSSSKYTVDAIYNMAGQPLFSFVWNTSMSIQVVTNEVVGGGLGDTYCRWSTHGFKAGTVLFQSPATLQAWVTPTYYCSVFAYPDSYGPTNGFITIGIVATVPDSSGHTTDDSDYVIYNVKSENNKEGDEPDDKIKGDDNKDARAGGDVIGPTKMVGSTSLQVPLLSLVGSTGFSLPYAADNLIYLNGSGFLGSCGEGKAATNGSVSDSSQVSIGRGGWAGRTHGCLCAWTGVTLTKSLSASSTASSTTTTSTSTTTTTTSSSSSWSSLSTWLTSSADGPELIVTDATVNSDSQMECRTPLVESSSDPSVAIVAVRSLPNNPNASPAFVMSNAIAISFTDANTFPVAGFLGALAIIFIVLGSCILCLFCVAFVLICVLGGTLVSGPRGRGGYAPMNEERPSGAYGGAYGATPAPPQVYEGSAYQPSLYQGGQYQYQSPPYQSGQYGGGYGAVGAASAPPQRTPSGLPSYQEVAPPYSSKGTDIV